MALETRKSFDYYFVAELRESRKPVLTVDEGFAFAAFSIEPSLGSAGCACGRDAKKNGALERLQGQSFIQFSFSFLPPKSEGLEKQ